MKKPQVRDNEAETLDPMEAAKRIMGRLVTTPAEPHETMVARRQAAKAQPKRTRRKKG